MSKEPRPHSARQDQPEHLEQQPGSGDPRSGDLRPIGPERLKALGEAIRAGTYPTERQARAGLMQLFLQPSSSELRSPTYPTSRQWDEVLESVGRFARARGTLETPALVREALERQIAAWVLGDAEPEMAALLEEVAASEPAIQAYADDARSLIEASREAIRPPPLDVTEARPSCEAASSLDATDPDVAVDQLVDEALDGDENAARQLFRLAYAPDSHSCAPPSERDRGPRESARLAREALDGVLLSLATGDLAEEMRLELQGLLEEYPEAKRSYEDTLVLLRTSREALGLPVSKEDPPREEEDCASADPAETWLPWETWRQHARGHYMRNLDRLLALVAERENGTLVLAAGGRRRSLAWRGGYLGFQQRDPEIDAALLRVLERLGVVPLTVLDRLLVVHWRSGRYLTALLAEERVLEDSQLRSAEQEGVEEFLLTLLTFAKPIEFDEGPAEASRAEVGDLPGARVGLGGLSTLWERVERRGGDATGASESTDDPLSPGVDSLSPLQVAVGFDYVSSVTDPGAEPEHLEPRPSLDPAQTDTEGPSWASDWAALDMEYGSDLRMFATRVFTESGAGEQTSAFTEQAVQSFLVELMTRGWLRRLRKVRTPRAYLRRLLGRHIRSSLRASSTEPRWLDFAPTLDASSADEVRRRLGAALRVEFRDLRASRREPPSPSPGESVRARPLFPASAAGTRRDRPGFHREFVLVVHGMWAAPTES